MASSVLDIQYMSDTLPSHVYRLRLSGTEIDFRISRDLEHLVSRYLHCTTHFRTFGKKMLSLSGEPSQWIDITLGDILYRLVDPAVWTKLAVLALAVGATRLYFSQNIPAPVPFLWPAPEVR
jgi:hypothetical protein